MSIFVHSSAATTCKPCHRSKDLIQTWLAHGSRFPNESPHLPPPCLLPRHTSTPVTSIFPPTPKPSCMRLLIGALIFSEVLLFNNWAPDNAFCVPCMHFPSLLPHSCSKKKKKRDLVKALMFTEPLLREPCGRWKSAKEINVYIKSN